MGLLGDVWVWLTSEASWRGSGIDPGILVRAYEHMSMSLQAVGLATLLVLPVGLYVGHTLRLEFVAVSAGNIGRALPSFGILGIAFIITTSLDVPGVLGFWATFIALVLLAIPPILTNAYIGIKGVDTDTVEAARGMGMSERDILLRLELPLAAPLIVAGLRLAAVQVVATATLGAVVAWGGLGRYIVDGLASGNDVVLLGGAFLVAGFAILTELAFSILERIVSPRTARRESRYAPRRPRPAPVNETATPG